MKAFYDSLRDDFGRLAVNQVAGIEFLLKATEGLPLRHRAYVLATAWHETGPASSDLHMTPRREIWGPTPAQKRYEGRADLGNTQPGDGKRFMGRGYVQITGRANYNRASTIVGRDLVSNPDLTMDPDFAAKIIVHGMVHGWFTGRKMSDFDSYVNMRRVVNGTDKAALIAGYAEKFEAAIKMLPAKPAGKPVEPAARVEATPPPASAETPPAPLPETGQSATAIIIGALGAIAAAIAAWIFGG